MSIGCAVFRIRENGEERCLQQNQASVGPSAPM